ncbi:hypothetical protein ACIA48_30060 [Mycobacterium sp. NPDC051804]
MDWEESCLRTQPQKQATCGRCTRRTRIRVPRLEIH